MKRAAFLFSAVVLALFGGITLVKVFQVPDSQETAGGISLSDKHKIQQFWQIYREATRLRIAGHMQQAEQKYEEALQLQPEHEDALYYLGNMYFELNKPRKAEQAWLKLLQTNPTSTRAHLQLGNLYLRFDPPDLFDPGKAEAEFERALALNGEESRALLRLGESALIRGDLALAQSRLNSMIASNSKNVEAYFLNGYLAWQRGDSTLAVSQLNQARKVAQTGKALHGVLGEGDSKGGTSLHVPGRSSPFASHLADLSAAGGANPSLEASRRYQALDATLTNIRRLGRF